MEDARREGGGGGGHRISAVEKACEEKDKQEFPLWLRGLRT